MWKVEWLSPWNQLSATERQNYRTVGGLVQYTLFHMAIFCRRLRFYLAKVKFLGKFLFHIPNFLFYFFFIFSYWNTILCFRKSIWWWTFCKCIFISGFGFSSFFSYYFFLIIFFVFLFFWGEGKYFDQNSLFLPPPSPYFFLVF